MKKRTENGREGGERNLQKQEGMHEKLKTNHTQHVYSSMARERERERERESFKRCRLFFFSLSPSPCLKYFFCSVCYYEVSP